MEVFLTIKAWLVWFAVAASALAFFVALSGGELTRAWRSSSRAGRWAFLAALAAATMFGGSKRGTVTFPYTDPESRYLFDRGSYVTNEPNDHVHLDFTRLSIVPAGANLYAMYRPAGSTNDDEWAEWFVATFGEVATPADLPFAGAMTNDFVFFTDWTPGPSAHTNGVAVVEWGGVTGPVARVSMPYTGIYVDGARLAPDPAITNGPAASLTLTTTTRNEEEDE